MARLCFRRPRDDLEFRSGIHAQKFVLPLPQSNGAQATLRVASKSLFEEALIEPSYLAEIGLDHLKTRRSIDRPKPFERGVDLGLAKPEFPPDRPQAPTADYRVGDCFVTLFLPDYLDLCAAHARASDAPARAYHEARPRPASPPQQSEQAPAPNNPGARIGAAVGSTPTGKAQHRPPHAAHARGLAAHAVRAPQHGPRDCIAGTPAGARLTGRPSSTNADTSASTSRTKNMAALDHHSSDRRTPRRSSRACRRSRRGPTCRSRARPWRARELGP